MTAERAVTQNIDEIDFGDPIELSVIVPVLDEPGEVRRFGDWWAQQKHISQQISVEVILVIGQGRQADECEVEARRFARVVSGVKPGRWRQMNAGAAGARGRVFFFLHIDSHPPAHFDSIILQTLAKRGVAAGVFSHRFEEWRESYSLAVISFINRFRYRHTGNYYGDQGLFLTRRAFAGVGGFPPMPLLEDIFMVKRLQRVGKVVCRSEIMGTSGRRFLVHGPWKTFFWMWWILIAHWCGRSIDDIARQYRAAGKKTSRLGRGDQTKRGDRTG